MFTRVATQLLRNSMPKTALKSNLLHSVTQRGFYKELGFESHALSTHHDDKETDAIEFWREHENKENALALKNHDEISNYVLQISKDYFRTTKKASLGLESSYRDHGLDSLDVIELIIQVEDDLGYLIDAENLEKFQKPKHFVNFIKQIEAYKEEFGKLPHETEKAGFSLDKLKAMFLGGKSH